MQERCGKKAAIATTAIITSTIKLWTLQMCEIESGKKVSEGGIKKEKRKEKRDEATSSASSMS